MTVINKYNFQLYTASNDLKFLPDNKKVKFTSVRSADLKTAMKRDITDAKERVKFDNDLKAIRKIIKNNNLDLDQFIVINTQHVMAYNMEHRYSVLITRNGAKQFKLFTAPMRSLSTKASGDNYYSFIFNTDRDQKSIDDCSRLGLESTKPTAQKKAESFESNCERIKEDCALRYLSTLSVDERIDFLIESLKNEAAGTDLIKFLAFEEAKTIGHDKAIAHVSKVAADLKRSQTQKENAKKEAIAPEGSDVDNFKAVMPKIEIVEVEPIKEKLNSIGKDTHKSCQELQPVVAPIDVEAIKETKPISSYELFEPVVPQIAEHFNTNESIINHSLQRLHQKFKGSKRLIDYMKVNTVRFYECKTIDQYVSRLIDSYIHWSVAHKPIVNLR